MCSVPELTSTGIEEDRPERGLAPAPVAIVDDDPSVRRAFARLMRGCGLSAVSYASAEEFLASARPHEVGCLLVDHYMSGMSGLELIDVLAKAGNLPPVVVVTAHASDALCVKARERGTTVLRKPVEIEALIAAVGHAIGRELRFGE
jgi:two-component system CheB/CheR fusion protein